jgi:uncharacterized protein involved in exopolysaccharide biosynthesis
VDRNERTAELSFAEAGAIWRRQKRVFFTVFVISFLVIFFAAMLQKPVYRGEMALAVQRRGQSTQMATEFAALSQYMGMASAQNIENQRRIVKSRPVLLATMNACGVHESYDEFYKRIGTNVPKETDILEVFVDAPSRSLAERWVSELVANYLREDARLRSDPTRDALAELEREAAQLKKELRIVDVAINAAEHAHGVLDISADSRELLKRLADLKADRQMTVIDQRATRQRHSALCSELKNWAPFRMFSASVARNAELDALNKQICELEVKRVGLLEKLGPQHPDLRQTESELARARELATEKAATVFGGEIHQLDMNRELLAAEAIKLSVELAANDARLAGLTDAIGRLEQKLKTQPDLSLSFTRLYRDQQVAQSTYLALRGKINELRVSGALQNQPSARILESPWTSDKPVRPRPLFALALALLGGLLCSGGYVAIRDSRAPRPCTASELSKLLGGLPAISVGPNGMKAAIDFVRHILSARGVEGRPVRIAPATPSDSAHLSPICEALGTDAFHEEDPAYADILVADSRVTDPLVLNNLPAAWRLLGSQPKLALLINAESFDVCAGDLSSEISTMAKAA